MKYAFIGLISFLSLGSWRALAADTSAASGNNLAEYSIPNFKNVDCEKTYKGSVSLYWGLCEYEKLSGMDQTSQEYSDLLDKVTRILSQAQQEGLTVRQQNVATLFEGLTHCEKAKFFWAGKKMIPSANGTGNSIPDDYSVLGFCSERAKASGSFSDVRFNDLLLNKTSYDSSSGTEKTNGHYAEDLIMGMASCQREVVAEYNRCGQLTPQPLVTVTEKAREIAQTEMVNYFGCTDVEYKKEMDAKRPGDPLTRCETLSSTAQASAMFARKISRLSLVTGTSAGKLSLLQQRDTQLKAQLAQYTTVYEEGRNAASQAFAAFQAATLMTDNIFKEYELWRAGLLGGNVIGDLGTRATQLDSYKSKMDQLATDLDVNTKRLAGMLVPPEVKREQLVELCRLN